MDNTANHLLQALGAYRQFVVCKADKVPLRVVDLKPASVTNAADWSSYDEAAARIAGDNSLILGFCLTDADPFTCIDLDSYKTKDASILNNHAEIFKSFNTYTELSPSGGGGHLWCKGKVDTRKFEAQFIEVYSTGRYMTVTFKVCNDAPVAERQTLLNQLVASIDAAKPRHVNTGAQVDGPQVLTDQQVLDCAFRASNGNVFSMLHAGNWKMVKDEAGLQKYPSQSEADIALCNMLAFYTDNREQVGRIYWDSPLFRNGTKRKRKADPDYLFNPKFGIVTKSFDQKSLPVDIRIQPPFGNNDFVEITSMENIEMEQLTWLWNGFLPKGKLTLLAGPSGVGKSTIAFSFAATVSAGAMWPDHTQSECGHVLIWSSEDDVADTILPRLVAMGAVRQNIHVLKSTTKHGVKNSFDPATDVPLLYQTIQRMGGKPSLLIIDPIVSAIAGDSHKSNDVRRGLQALVDMAAELDMAVLGITHFAKNSQGRNPVERIIGSQAFAAFARVNLVAAENEETGERVFCKAQTNISKDKGGFTYTIEVRPLDNNIIGTAIVWGGSIEGNARKILGGIEDGDESGKERKKQVQQAEEFLIKELKDGPRTPKELAELAKNVYGIHEKALQRARARLNIQPIKDGKNAWIWKLPLTSEQRPTIQQQAQQWVSSVATVQ